jgi:hypothetical protein
MRSVRTIAIGCTAAVCAFGAMSAPAFAKELKPQPVFGKFVASTSGKTSATGEVSELRLGPYKFTGEQLFNESNEPILNGSGEPEFGPICSPLKAKGAVEAGESESLTQKIAFAHCVAYRSAGTGAEGLKERVTAHFKLGLEFHSNHSATTGEVEESEVTLIPESTVTFTGSHSTCTVEIPSQSVPIKAEKDPEEEFEAALYETEEESTEGSKTLEKKFGPEHDRLNVETEFSHVKTDVPLGNKCETKKGGEEHKYTNGVIDLELEDITLKGGNLSFVPAPEA